MNASLINDFSTMTIMVIRSFFTQNPKIIDSFYNEILLINEKVKWGTTVSKSYILKIMYFFEKNLSLVDWLRQWSKNDEEEVYIRGFWVKCFLVERKL